MVFKRRTKLSWGQWIAEGFYPKAGWKRAASYVAHRIRRLPDTPHKIAMGIAAGVYVSYTPFFGLHFLVAALLAIVLRGNVLAALLGTFFGNPLTFPFIAASALGTGHFILGSQHRKGIEDTILSHFGGAFADLWHNFTTLFSGGAADWSRLEGFFSSVYLPYLVGGVLPGLISGVIVYFLSRPLIVAYQARRKGRLLARFKERRSKSKDAANHAEG
jgi:uncharacterized protein (DUF2062 family)